MTSRTARQRYRRRQARLKASAPAPVDLLDQWGWRNPAPHHAGDLALIRQAIHRNWSLSDSTKAAIAHGMGHLLEHPASPVRVTLAVAKTALKIEQAIEQGGPAR